jgi:hypothetical protein
VQQVLEEVLAKARNVENRSIIVELQRPCETMHGQQAVLLVLENPGQVWQLHLKAPVRPGQP